MKTLPDAFVERIKRQFPDESDALLNSLENQANTSVHLHPWKGLVRFEESSPVCWFERGSMLRARPSFTLDPLFHAGCYYPQESSSMFLYYVLEQLYGNERSLTALDLCAAPGGKSILISSFLGKEGKLISNEVIRTRNSILRENLTKWGADNTVVTCNEAIDFSLFVDSFDFVVTDVPCSGEGMFRKDVKSREEWSVENVLMCAIRQQRIVEDITPSIKPGGYLIYSTCTFSPEEDELQIENLIRSGVYEEVHISVPEDWNLFRPKHGLQFLPHRISGEGFYIAVLRKVASSANAEKVRSKPVFQKVSKSNNQQISEVLDIGNHQLLQTARGDIYASRFNLEELNKFVNRLYITMPGIELGTFIREDFIAAHALATSPFTLKNIQRIDVDEQTALQFLRGESLQIQGEKGRALITYRNVPLGWVKILNNRANNYYPKEWRIRML